VTFETGTPFNYRYFLGKVACDGGKSLDYGCGRGRVIELALARGLDLWGADTFEGGYEYWDRARSQSPGDDCGVHYRIPHDCIATAAELMNAALAILRVFACRLFYAICKIS
jgi:hypothetical protein